MYIPLKKLRHSKLNFSRTGVTVVMDEAPLINSRGNESWRYRPVHLKLCGGNSITKNYFNPFHSINEMYHL
jgi:hypothetical protein